MNTKTKTVLILSVLMAFMLLLASCAPQAPSPVEAPTTEAPAPEILPTKPPTELPTEAPTEIPIQPPTEVPPEPTETGPQYGGTMIVASSAEPTTLNPLNNLYVTQMISGQLFPALLEYNFDMTPKPSLADSWEISSDGLNVTFHIVENATWTDGMPITSADVKFSFEEAIIPLHPSGESTFGVVESIDTPDDKTVVFNFGEPFSPFMSYLAHQNAPILPKHIYEGTDIMENENNFKTAVSGGPFVFKEWIAGDHITLVRNDTYFKEGLPYLDQVVFRFIPDPQGRVLALEAGEVDYIPPINMPETEMDRVRDTDGLVLATTGFESSAPFFQWGFNLRREPFNDVLVRRALSYAVNKDFIKDAVFFGYGDDIAGPISPRSWAYDPDAIGYEYDPEKAKEMLDAAGYPEGSDSTRFSMTITYPGDINSYVKGAEVIAANFEDIHVKVELVAMERSAYYPTVYEDWDFDLAGVTWGSGPDPNNIATIYHSDQIRKLIFTNYMGYSNPEVDALFDQAKAETELDVRKELYQEAQRILIEDAPAIWVIGPHRNSAYREGFHGIPPGPFYGTRDPADQVWTEIP